MSPEAVVITSLVVAEFARELYVVNVLPKRANRALARHEKKKARRLWLAVSRSQTLFINDAKTRRMRHVVARFNLAFLLMQDFRYDEAICEFEALIPASISVPSFEAEIHLKLADCFEAKKNSWRASEERETARFCLEKPFAVQRDSHDVAKASARATIAKQEYRVDDELVALEEALRLAEQSLERRQAPVTQDQHLLLLSKLARAYYHQGQQTKALQCAEKGLQLSDGKWSGQHLLHSITGNLYAGQGQLDKAYEQRLLLLKLQESRRDAAGIVKAKAELSVVAVRMGRFAQAESVAQEALSHRTEWDRLALASLGLSYFIRGDITHLRATREQLRTANRVWQPRSEEYANALFTLEDSRVKSRYGDASEAVKLAETALTELERHKRLKLRAQAALSWALACANRSDESQAARLLVQQQLADFSDDRLLQFICHTDLARSCVALKKWDEAREHWQQCLALEPDPCSLPNVFYGLGECEEALGHLKKARSWWQRAVDVPIEDTFDAGQARTKLAAI